MKPGVQISNRYVDDHLIQLRIAASNGVFAGQADLYVDSGSLTELADALRGFPTSPRDIRQFELGSFDGADVCGGAKFRFFCVDSVGHAMVEVNLRNDLTVEFVTNLVVVHIAIEAAAIDSFIKQLESMATLANPIAMLEARA